MVNAGGDTALLGDRLGKPWVVGIRDPRKDGAVVARIPLQDEAISTSGDYERYFEENGQRYHHILVPGTGKSPDAVRSVTVIGANATRTDGLTKTVFILGVERGMAFIRKLGDVEADHRRPRRPGLLFGGPRAPAIGQSGASPGRFVTRLKCLSLRGRLI